MDVELLSVPGCPHAGPAYELVCATIAELDLSPSITQTVIETVEQAEARHFLGSPTFRIDGRDAFDVHDAEPGLACRMYATPAGLAGVPSREALLEAFRRAAC